MKFVVSMLLNVATLCQSAAELAAGELPELHVVTFMNQLHRHFAYLQVSAAAHQILPQVLGYGKESWWPDGLGIKINALRNFSFHGPNVKQQDIVVFADAFDVMVFGMAEEIVDKFLKLEEQSGSSIIFNAERYCYPPVDGLCDSTHYPESTTHKRYLNSGLIVGRVWALRQLLREPVPNIIKGSDQRWYQEQYRSQYTRHNNSRDEVDTRGGGDTRVRIELDRSCQLVCAVSSLDFENGLRLSDDGRIVHDRIDKDDKKPPLVHFPGDAHWPKWRDDEPSPSNLNMQVFEKLYPEEANRLLNHWHLNLELGTTHDVRIYNGEGFWAWMRLVLCVQCNLLGSKVSECESFNGFLQPRCVWWTILVLLLTTLPVACYLVPKHLLVSKQRCNETKKICPGVELSRWLPPHLSGYKMKSPEFRV